jgi:hypothetical protein
MNGWQTWPGWRKVMACAIVATALGSLLPWVSIFGVTVYGIEGDGQITFGAAVVGAVVFLLHNTGRAGRRLMLVVEAVGAVVVSLVALYDKTNVSAFRLAQRGARHVDERLSDRLAGVAGTRGRALSSHHARHLGSAYIQRL